MAYDVSERLKKAEVEIGEGRNDFTMNRGSFRYRKAYFGRRRLSKTGIVETAKGFRVLYEDDATGKDYSLDVKHQNGLWEAALRGDFEGFNRYWLILPSHKNEEIYGCGETYSELNLKQNRVRIYVAEHQNAARITGKIVREKIRGPRYEHRLAFEKYESYYVQPTFVSSEKYFFHADTKEYAEFDFREEHTMTLHFNEPPVFVMGEGESYEDISREMRKVFGYYGKLPDWVHDGVILAIQEGCAAVDRRVKAAKDAGAKVCGVWSQDWCGCRKTGFGYQVMWNWEADEELYPELQKKIAEWKAAGVHFLGYINPFMALEKPLYKYAAEHGYCVKDREGKDYLVTITTFPAAMIDFTNPEAYDWYKGLIKKNMIGIGMSGWMADFGEYLPPDALLYNGEDAAKWHNVWPAVWAKMNREAIEECGKKDELFYFTRAGYSGSVGNTPMMWTGDQHVDWSVDDGLPSVIPATLSLAMSGQPVTHSDIGGYTTIMHMTRSGELLMRWEEANVFTPLYRMHEGNQPSRNVQFDKDDELLKHLAKMSKIHAALKPYIQRLEKDAEEGLPMMRPVFYHYEKVKMPMTQYLFGRDLLVSPVLKPQEAKHEVWLPEDEWIGLWDEKTYAPGSHTVDAPVGVIPVFVRKNAEEITEDVLRELRKAFRTE